MSLRPRLKSRSWSPLLEPPVNNLTSNPLCQCVSLVASWAICVASSRVGLMTTVPAVLRACVRLAYSTTRESGWPPFFSGASTPASSWQCPPGAPRKTAGMESEGEGSSQASPRHQREALQGYGAGREKDHDWLGIVETKGRVR
jgi:hypothetical protein